MLPALYSADHEEELNRFLRSVKVLNIKKEFVTIDGSPFWSMLIEYLYAYEKANGSGSKERKSTSKIRVDYKELLSQEDFVLFSKLREWRKETANQEGIPLYTICTNEQLAKIAENRLVTRSALQKLEGFGEARLKKYGDAVLSIVNAAAAEPESDQKESDTRSNEGDGDSPTLEANAPANETKTPAKKGHAPAKKATIEAKKSPMKSNFTGGPSEGNMF